jgi:hypothetical protein
MRRGIEQAVLVALFLPLLAACPNDVNPDKPDTTPPSLSLDAYGIPAQPGASSSPNPETINTACCDVLRLVHPGDIDLLAAGVDADSGIRGVQIRLSGERRSCIRADGTGSNQGPGSDGTAAETRSDTGGTTPASAPDRLVAQFRFTVQQRSADCQTYAYEAIVYARAENWAGMTVDTKRFTLRYTVP